MGIHKGDTKSTKSVKTKTKDVKNTQPTKKSESFLGGLIRKAKKIDDPEEIARNFIDAIEMADNCNRELITLQKEDGLTLAGLKTIQYHIDEITEQVDKIARCSKLK